MSGAGRSEQCIYSLVPLIRPIIKRGRKSEFSTIKELLADVSLLCYSYPGAPIYLVTDASSVVAGALLQHCINVSMECDICLHFSRIFLEGTMASRNLLQYVQS